MPCNYSLITTMPVQLPIYNTYPASSSLCSVRYYIGKFANILALTTISLTLMFAPYTLRLKWKSNSFILYNFLALNPFNKYIPWRISNKQYKSSMIIVSPNKSNTLHFPYFTLKTVYIYIKQDQIRSQHKYNVLTWLQILFVVPFLNRIYLHPWCLFLPT